MVRPEKQVDWNKVDQLLMANCHGTEIAPHFDMHVNTFYDKVVEHTKMSFTEYSALKKQQGESLLKHKQFCRAMGYCNDGDNTMLIWLGKNRLGQRENQETTSYSQEDLERAARILEQVTKNQSLASDRKIESTNNNAEDKS